MSEASRLRCKDNLQVALTKRPFGRFDGAAVAYLKLSSTSPKIFYSICGKTVNIML